MQKCIRLTIPYHHVGATLENRFDNFRDLLAGVLVIGVGINDDIGAELEGGVDPYHERNSQPLVFLEDYDVAHAEFFRKIGSTVRTPVVDDEDLDALDPWNLSREPDQSLLQVLALVKTGDLNDEFHGGFRSDNVSTSWREYEFAGAVVVTDAPDANFGPNLTTVAGFPPGRDGKTVP
jgi:hypothetical protein